MSGPLQYKWPICIFKLAKFTFCFRNTFMGSRVTKLEQLEHYCIIWIAICQSIRVSHNNVPSVGCSFRFLAFTFVNRSELIGFLSFTIDCHENVISCIQSSWDFEITWGLAVTCFLFFSLNPDFAILLSPIFKRCIQSLIWCGDNLVKSELVGSNKILVTKIHNAWDIFNIIYLNQEIMLFFEMEFCLNGLDENRIYIVMDNFGNSKLHLHRRSTSSFLQLIEHTKMNWPMAILHKINSK